MKINKIFKSVPFISFSIIAVCLLSLSYMLNNEISNEEYFHHFAVTSLCIEETPTEEHCLSIYKRIENALHKKGMLTGGDVIISINKNSKISFDETVNYKSKLVGLIKRSSAQITPKAIT